MDIKIHFTKRSTLIGTVMLFCGLIAVGGWYYSPLKARHDIKATCQNNCACFGNIVDYRLTNEQVHLFAKFMKELNKRKDANVLEFMDATDAVRIQQAFVICQPQVQTRAEQQPSADKTTKNKRKDKI